MTACRHASMTLSVEHPDYDVCLTCGSFRSRIAPPPEEVYTDSYWTHERNHSTLQEQVWNCEQHLENGISKNNFLLSLIDVEDCSAALEIGCAPGALLARLVHDAGFSSATGVEMEVGDFSSLLKMHGSRIGVVRGLFPHVSKAWSGSQFDLVVASDVFEHSHEPEAFLAECARLLKPGGQLLLMLPLVDRAQVIEMPERMWQADEHVWLHSVGNLCAMLGEAGFERMTLSQWTAGHEVISARRAPAQPADYDQDGEGSCLPCP